MDQRRPPTAAHDTAGQGQVTVQPGVVQRAAVHLDGNLSVTGIGHHRPGAYPVRR